MVNKKRVILKAKSSLRINYNGYMVLVSQRDYLMTKIADYLSPSSAKVLNEMNKHLNKLFAE